MEKFVNKVILDKVDEIVSDIKKSKKYQDYLFLREKLKNNTRVTNLILEIKDIQKSIVKKESLKEDIKNLELLLEEKNTLLNQIPLYSDFIQVQSDLNLEFQLLKQELDNYFDNILN